MHAHHHPVARWASRSVGTALLITVALVPVPTSSARQTKAALSEMFRTSAGGITCIYVSATGGLDLGCGSKGWIEASALACNSQRVRLRADDGRDLRTRRTRRDSVLQLEPETDQGSDEGTRAGNDLARMALHLPRGEGGSYVYEPRPARVLRQPYALPPLLSRPRSASARSQRTFSVLDLACAASRLGLARSSWTGRTRKWPLSREVPNLLAVSQSEDCGADSDGRG